jgi:nitroimidazol reductase NimA-like FMN-containing flavoprotein (pyridoxamine 5'-phosphate oxidase superfamily)
MAMTYLSRSRLVELEDAECWSLLRSHQYGVGRVAFAPPGARDAAPEVLPVNFLLDGQDVVVQTGTGVLHDAALHGLPIAFEVDSVDSPAYGQRQAGWSVLVKGRAELVGEAAQQAFLRLSHLAPAAGGFKPNFVRIGVESISGRRF